MRTILLRFFLFLFIAIGGLMLYWGGQEVWRARASKSWPTCPGQIKSSSVEYRRGDKESRGSYHAEVLYEYTVGGTLHSSNAISYGLIGTSDPGGARSVVNRYPEGMKVTVYYSPEEPSRSVLEPGISGGVFLLPGLGAAFLLGGVVAFIYAPGSLARQRRGSRYILSSD